MPARRQIDLTIRQVHADLPFENAFHLPVQVEVVTAAGARVHEVAIDGWSTQVSLPADGRPSYVVFDKGGWLVSETRQERPLEEALRQLAGGGLAEKLRAARESRERFPRRPEAVAALAAILADPARALGAPPGGGRRTSDAWAESRRWRRSSARRADPDPRARRAVAHGLAAAGGAAADAALRRMVETDAAEDVVAVAAAGVGTLRRAGRPRVPRAPARRARRRGGTPSSSAWSRAWPTWRTPPSAPVFERYVDPRVLAHAPAGRARGMDRVRARRPAAPRAAPRAGPGPQPGHPRRGPGRPRRLHRAEDVAFLREYAEAEADENLAVAAARRRRVHRGVHEGREAVRAAALAASWRFPPPSSRPRRRRSILAASS